MPCPYAYILGVPGQGVHSWRIGPVSGNDVIATIIVAIATAYYYKISIIYSLIGWFVAGEVLHWIFGTPTAFLVGLGLERHCS